MDCTEFTRLPGFWNNGEWRCLEGSDECFNFMLGAGAKISFFAEFIPLDVFICFGEFVKGRAIGRCVSVKEFWNACVETELNAMGKGGISVKEVVVLQRGCPGGVVVERACIKPSVLEDKLERHDPNFRILSICDVGDGRLLSIQ